LPERPERLVDISQKPDEFSASFTFDDGLIASQEKAYALRVGYQQSRQSASLSRQWIFGKAYSWLGAGLARHADFLDSAGFAGLNTGIATERWIFSGWAVQQKKRKYSAETLWGWTETKAASGLLRSARATVSSLRLSTNFRTTDKSAHQLSLAQPLSIEIAQFTFAGLEQNRHTPISFKRQSRDIKWSYGFDYALAQNLNSSVHLHTIQQDISTASFANNEVSARLRWAF